MKQLVTSDKLVIYTFAAFSVSVCSDIDEVEFKLLIHYDKISFTVILCMRSGGDSLEFDNQHVRTEASIH